jgi:3-dehydroquinate dehydratase type I
MAMGTQGLLCVPVQARDTNTARGKILRAGAWADLVELRLDRIGRPNVDALVSISEVPVIATVRSRGEGGAETRGPDRTADLLLHARRAGAAYVDVEFGLPRDIRRTLLREVGPHRVILSCHVTDRTPPMTDLMDLLERMAEEGAAIIKIVCRARRCEDNRNILSLVPEAQARGVGISAFCMGREGMVSRILSLRLGATLGYASLDERDATAEGQIPIRLMRLMLQPPQHPPRAGLSASARGPKAGAHMGRRPETGAGALETKGTTP